MTSLNKALPKVIKKLDETVVNRISAGEVIHRPVNVVKELIENSLDANATAIEVSVKDGGMKSIVIEDNGSGIRKEDLDIVCERFTTSKLDSMEDLLQIQTYGFRGEALASISHISYVTITTKTDEQFCGFKLQFIDGKPKSKASPLAANNGTIITVENLFYNLLMRRNALNSYSHEYNLIMDLITKYAIHNSNRVSFSVKKMAENCDLNTSIGNTTVQNIRGLYGPNIGNNLIEISFADETRLQFAMNGYISVQSLNQKNFVFILFINDRLVDCPSLRKAIDLLYSNYLMKGFHPFVYLSIRIDSKNVDVNVHPTKSEVHFLHEQDICEQIIDLIQKKISNGESRPMKSVDSLMNTSFSQTISQTLDSNDSSEGNSSIQKRNSFEKSNSKSRKESPKQSTPVRPQKQIRTDSKDRRIDEFLLSSKRNAKTRRQIRLKSVLELRRSVADDSDPRLQDMICGSSYVGCVDETFVLLQYETQLLLANASHLNRELFYQLFLIDFANFSRIKFAKPLPISQLVQPYLDHLDGLAGEAGAQRLSATEIEKILMDNRAMIKDYFSITISDAKELIALPILLDGFAPNFGHLPQFVYCLAKDVNWQSEKECFESIGRVLAKFYAMPPLLESDSDHQKWAKIVETVVYPTYKAVLCPSKLLSNNSTFFVTTKLSDLYKVFERC